MEAILLALPFLAFLACPVVMAFCLFRMRKPGSDAPPAAKLQAGSQLPEEQVAALQQQLHASETELTTLQGRNEYAFPDVTHEKVNQPVDVVPKTVYAG